MTGTFKYDAHSFNEAKRTYASHARQTDTPDKHEADAWFATYVDEHGNQIPQSGGAPLAAVPAQPLGSQVGETAAPPDESPVPDTNVLDWLK